MPGPSLTQFDAARKAATPTAGSPAAAAPQMYQATEADTPFTAGAQELARTAKEAGIGVLRSPLDLISSILHPIDTVKGMANTVAHPVDALHHLEDNPRDAGSLLGQLLLGKAAGAVDLPAAAGTAADVVGRGTEAVGRGMTAVGESAPARGAAALNAVVRPGMSSMAELAIPPALEYGGRLLQKGGKSLQGLKDAVKGETAAAGEATPLTKEAWQAKAADDFPYQRGAADTMSNAPDQNPGELYPYQRDSLAALKNVAGDMTPASNAGAAAAEIGHPGAQAVLDRWKAQPSSGVADKMSLEGQFGPEQKAWAENKYGGEGVVDLSDASAPAKPVDIHQQLLDSLAERTGNRGGNISQDDALHFNDELQAIQQLSPLDKLARMSARSRALRTGQPIAPDF